MIRPIADFENEIQAPFWANAKLTVPRHPLALVVLAHNDDTRHDHLRRQIAEHLAAHRLASCAVRLTGADEHFVGRMAVDIETLCDRLRAVLEFAATWEETRELPLAVFGEDYCAAAAMMVAAEKISYLAAAGAYCGRPDLAHIALPEVRTATLLIVPGLDRDLLNRNERAFSKLTCQSQIAIIGNATRGLREAGATHACRYLIRRWCQQHAVHCHRRALAG